jgi:hypothetical protein
MPESQAELDKAIVIQRRSASPSTCARSSKHLEKHRHFDLDDRTHLPEHVRARARFELKTFEIDFSDSFVIAVPFDDPSRPDQALTAVRMLVASVAAMMLDAHSLARPLRAGVDLGVGVPLEKGELYGPALVRPYLLESHEAGYPRALVGKSLLDRLMLIERILPTTDEERVAQVHASKTLRMVSADTDGKTIVDYLGPAFAPTSGSRVDQPRRSRLAYSKPRPFHRVRHEAGDRYARLVSYIESHGVWTNCRAAEPKGHGRPGAPGSSRTSFSGSGPAFICPSFDVPSRIPSCTSIGRRVSAATWEAGASTGAARGVGVVVGSPASVGRST